MTKKDVQVGHTYVMNHTSGMVHVRINQVITRGGWGKTKEMTHWLATNLKTGREIEIKSAVKLIREV
jgi:hypothetical protein